MLKFLLDFVLHYAEHPLNTVVAVVVGAFLHVPLKALAVRTWTAVKPTLVAWKTKLLARLP